MSVVNQLTNPVEDIPLSKETLGGQNTQQMNGDDDRLVDEILDELKVGYEVLDECNISFQRLYKDYCESLMLNNKRRIVSKHYFLKYIGKVIPQQYIKNNYILCDYWN